MNVSVAMATFNGEKYIIKQLDSICKQLIKGDEIIISDDNSTDNTLKIIEESNCSFINIYFNSYKKTGVITNFENALKYCKNDIIILADQDDIWLPDRVGKIRTIFTNDEKVQVIVCNAEIIDDNYNRLGNMYERRNSKSGFFKNIIRNSYLGCTMAFKKRLLTFVLPFPKDIPMHDIWIGIIGDLIGKVLFINDTLVLYRRHDLNVTSFNHGSLLVMFRQRIKLIKNVIIRLFVYYFRNKLHLFVTKKF